MSAGGAGSGGAASGSANAGSSGALTMTAGQGGAAGAGGSGAGGVVSCDTFADDPGYQLMVHIKNARAETLYLGPDDDVCAATSLYEVEDGAREKLPVLTGCVSSCQAMMTGAAACPSACTAPSTVALQPGQTIDLPWDGRFGVAQTLPAQCLKNGGPVTTCTQAQKIEAGVFTFVARAGTKRECLAPGGACSCTNNPNGGCTAPSSVIAGTIYTSEFLIALEPAETSPAGEPQYIEIVFR